MFMELVLLFIVESVFDFYVMFGVNVVGIWQIILSMGCNYGLKQICNYDVCCDVVVLIIVVLNMMQCLNKMFDGDWFLIVVVYNSGEGWVMKVIKMNKVCGKFMDFWLLLLLQEMKQYVFKMLVLSDIFKNSKCYGVRLLTIDESCVLVCVYLSSLVEMVKVVDMVGIFVSKLKIFNVGVKGFMLGVSGLQYVMVLKKYVD